MKAEQLLYAVAANVSTFEQNPEGFLGYLEKVRKNAIDFIWTRSGKPRALTITARGVVASRQPFEGKTWYGYTLEPFGADVSYSEANRFARLMLEKHNIRFVA